MYKKITTIEEHYDKQDQPSGFYSNEYSPDNVKLKLDIRDCFAQYVSDMRNYVISKVNNTDDINEIASRIRSDVMTLITIIQPRMSVAEASNLADSMIATTTEIINVVNTAATGTDATKDVANAKAQIDRLAMVLENLSLLLHMNTAAMWYSFLSSTQNQVMFKKQKKYSDEQNEYDNAYNILVNGVLNGASSFADSLTKGILNRP